MKIKYFIIDNEAKGSVNLYYIEKSMPLFYYAKMLKLKLWNHYIDVHKLLGKYICDITSILGLSNKQLEIKKNSLAHIA